MNHLQMQQALEEAINQIIVVRSETGPADAYVPASRVIEVFEALKREAYIASGWSMDS